MISYIQVIFEYNNITISADAEDDLEDLIGITACEDKELEDDTWYEWKEIGGEKFRVEKKYQEPTEEEFQAAKARLLQGKKEIVRNAPPTKFAKKAALYQFLADTENEVKGYLIC